MSIAEVIMFRVICDRCGVSAQEDEFYAWADKDQAISEAESGDWLIRDDGHWCLRCTIYDGDTDEYLPDPAPLQPTGAPS